MIKINEFNFKNSLAVKHNSSMKEMTTDLHSIGVNGFLFNRFYDDSSSSVLTDIAECQELFISNKIYQDEFYGKYEDYQEGLVFVERNNAPKTIQLYHEVAGFNTILVDIKKGESHIDFFYFFSRKEGDIVNSYFNNLAFIYNYEAFFYKKANKIISEMENEKIIFERNRDVVIPPRQRESYIQGEINARLAKELLTAAEQNCLSLLNGGNTKKETSEKLNISKRTLEKHIENIRRKLKKTTGLIDF